jgi:O-antigen ligase
MKQWLKFRKLVQQYEQTVYTALCIGIVYTLVFWTLLNSILCLTLAGFWLVFTSKQGFIPVKKKAVIVLFSSLYLLVLAGLLYTSNMKEGLHSLQQKSAIILFPVVFGATRILTPKTIKVILLHFLIATAFACIAGFMYGTINFLDSGDITMLTREHLILFPDIYPYTMGLFCLLSIIIVYQLLPHYRNKKRRYLLLLAAFLSMFIILLSVRLIILCWLFTILYLSFKRYIKGFYYRLSAVLLLISVLVISIIIIPSLRNQWIELKDFSDINTIKLDQDASLGHGWGGKAIRLAIWKCSKDVIQKHWLTGVGTGDIQDTLQMAYNNRQFYFASHYNKYNAHNQYIQTFIGHGITGIIVLIMCILVPFTLYKQQLFSVAYFLFLFLFCAICFTEVILDTNKGIIWYSFFNSIFAFNERETPDHNRSTT